MASYTDDFNRASLGANWVADSGAWSINSSTVLNQTTASNYRKCRWAGGAMASTNVYSQVLGESPNSSQAFGAYVRGSGGATVTYYALLAFGSDAFYLVEITAGGESILASGGTCTAATPYTLNMEADGSSLTGNYGAGELTASDSSLTGNDVGCMSYGLLNNTTTAYIDNWAAADLAAGGVVGPLLDGHLINHGILAGRLSR